MEASGTDVDPPGSLGELFRLLAPSLWVGEKPNPPAWPPDLFALVCAALHKSGAYLTALERWPPPKTGNGPQSLEEWAGEIRLVGAAWRSCALKEMVPERVRTCWELLVQQRQTLLSSLQKPDAFAVTSALLELLAMADEACVGVGLPAATTGNPTEPTLKDDLDDQLYSTSTKKHDPWATLCKEVGTHWATVLPKVRTPQQGVTLRSFSHHLAFLPAGETRVRWWTFPSVVGQRNRDHSLNLLIVPWPFEVRPQAFSMVGPSGEPGLPREFGLFDYQPPDQGSLAKLLVELWRAAETRVGLVHAILLPELALREEEWRHLSERFYTDVTQVHGPTKWDRYPLLVTGVLAPGSHPSSSGASKLNQARVKIPVPPTETTSDQGVIEVVQPKNHRWKLDASQVERYGLSAQLDPARSLWENCVIRDRMINFFAVRDWLSFCVLICEDLARPDPVSDVIRAVGPNLVIALLLDGPQLADRWPARYATVLADDPGSSVLTLTSLGMSLLSSPPPGKPPRRAVALWRDGGGGSMRELELPEGAEALLLTLTKTRTRDSEEWSADGRSCLGDRGLGAKEPKLRRETPYLRLTGVSPIAAAPKNP
jgi:hypothetical protein